MNEEPAGAGQDLVVDQIGFFFREQLESSRAVRGNTGYVGREAAIGHGRARKPFKSELRVVQVPPDSLHVRG